MKALYCGIFLDKRSVDKLTAEQTHTLARLIPNMHCTFAFMPSSDVEEAFRNIIGKPVSLLITGYGSDENNSGFSVAIPNEYLHLYHGNRTPHITVSLSENGKAVNTTNLPFENISPFYVNGTFGICYDCGVER